MKRWVQLAIVSVMLIATINIGVLNFQTMKQRENLNRIGALSQMGDELLYRGLCVMNTRTKALAVADTALYNNTSLLASRIGQVASMVEDVQVGLAVHENAVQNVVAQRMPSVVGIVFEYEYLLARWGEKIPMDPSTGKPFDSGGCGVIVHESGIVLTVAHILRTPDRSYFGPITRAYVVFEDGTERDLTAWVSVPEGGPDVGFVKFDPTGLNLRVVPMDTGIRETLRKGDPIVVLGSPAGFHHSVAIGIVADPYQDVDIPKFVGDNLVQISAHVTGGNSGGPVFDMKGNLLGTVSFGTVGVGSGPTFIVPVDLILEGLAQLGEIIDVP